MDNNEILDNDYVSDIGLSLNGGIRAHLLSSAKWGKFLGIVGFVFTGLIVIIALGLGTVIGSFGESGALGGGIAILYIVLAILYFLPTYYLYQFSTSIKKSLEREEQVELEKAFHNLNRLFTFAGIMTAIVLAIYLLSFFFGFLAMDLLSNY